MSTATTTPAEEIAWARRVYEAAYRARWSGDPLATVLTDLWGAFEAYEKAEAAGIAREAGDLARLVLDALPGIADDINGGN